MYRLKQVFVKALGINMLMQSLNELNRIVSKKIFMYFTVQLLLMGLILFSGYALSMLVESVLIQYIPVNNITTFLSVIVVVAVFAVTLIAPLLFGYFYNQYVIKNSKYLN